MSALDVIRPYLALPVFVAAFAALMLASALGACSPAIDAQLHEAQSLVAAGEPRAALPLLERVIQRRPEDGAANLLLGQVLIQIGQPRPAVPLLARAMESERYAVPAGLLLASAQLNEGHADAALETIDRVLATHPDQPAALRVRASALLSTGDAEGALASARHLIEVAPDDSQAPLLIGTALTRLDRLDEAEEILSSLEASARDAGTPMRHANACAAHATFLASGRQDADRAEAAWLDCFERHPGDAQVLQGATSFFDHRGEPERSLALHERALAATPDALGIRLALASRLAAGGAFAEGDRLLADHAEASGRPEAWQAVAIFRRDRGDRAGALEAVKSGLAAPGVDGDALRSLQAGLLIDAGELAAAREVIEGIEAPELHDIVDAQRMLAEGQPEEALGVLERAVVRTPTDARPRYLAGLAHQSLGQIDEALRAFTLATELDADVTDAALAAARLHAALGEPQRTIAFLQRHRGARSSGRRETVLLETQALLELGQAAAAATHLERNLPDAAESPDALPLLVRAIEAAHGPAAALARIERARSQGVDLTAPAHLATFERFGQLAIAQGQPERALSAVDAAIAAAPDAARHHALRGAFASAAGDPVAAEASFRRAVELDPDDPLALTSLARWLAGTGQREEALATFERAERGATGAAERKTPAQVEASFQAARLLAAEGRTKEAEAKLRAAVAANPLHSGASNDLAWLLAEDQRELDWALSLAQRAARLAPGGPTYDTLGWVLVQRGEFEDAVATLEQAVSHDPDSPGFQYRLGLALDRSGETDRARAAYRQALEGGPFQEAEAARAALARLEGNEG